MSNWHAQLAAIAGPRGVIDHKTSVDHSSALIYDSPNLRIVDIYPEHPDDDDDGGNTYLVVNLNLDTGEVTGLYNRYDWWGIETPLDLLNKWFNMRGRMDLASQSEGHDLIDLWSHHTYGSD